MQLSRTHMGGVSPEVFDMASVCGWGVPCVLGQVQICRTSNQLENLMGKRLTKSRFSMGLSCPQKLIYEAADEVYVDQRKNNSMLEGLAEGGLQLGALAKTLFRQADGLSALRLMQKDRKNRSSRQWRRWEKSR